MNTLGWRIAPIFFLGIRQFIGGKAVWAVLALVLTTPLMAFLYILEPEMNRPRPYLDDIFVEWMFPTVLPLAALILATAAFGDEIEDRTLPYLVLKPITRLRIVIEKLLSATFVSVPIIAFGGLLSFVFVFRGDGRDNMDLIWATLAATVVGVLLYSSVFMLMSLLFRRAVLAAIIYSLVWESILGRFVPGLRYVSIRQVVTSVYTSMVERLEPTGRADFGLGTDNAFGLSSSVVAAAVVCVIAVLLSTWRLSKINIE